MLSFYIAELIERLQLFSAPIPVRLFGEPDWQYALRLETALGLKR
jgi:hypothetical protein